MSHTLPVPAVDLSTSLDRVADGAGRAATFF